MVDSLGTLPKPSSKCVNLLFRFRRLLHAGLCQSHGASRRWMPLPVTWTRAAPKAALAGSTYFARMWPVAMPQGSWCGSPLHHCVHGLGAAQAQRFGQWRQQTSPLLALSRRQSISQGAAQLRQRYGLCWQTRETRAAEAEARLPGSRCGHGQRKRGGILPERSAGRLRCATRQESPAARQPPFPGTYARRHRRAPFSGGRLAMRFPWRMPPPYPRHLPGRVGPASDAFGKSRPFQPLPAHEHRGRFYRAGLRCVSMQEDDPPREIGQQRRAASTAPPSRLS
jgi:hypothetical protein